VATCWNGYLNKEYFSREGPWPNQTKAYFWPAVNKRLACLWPGTFWPDPKRFFFIWRGKIKKIHILGEIFQTQTKNGWPGSTRVKNIWLGPMTIFSEPSSPHTNPLCIHVNTLIIWITIWYIFSKQLLWHLTARSKI